MRVLLAFDKFKDALSSAEACAIAAQAVGRAHPDWSLDSCPLADGGEGFCEILTRAAGGELEAIGVSGPRGARVTAPIGFVRVEKIPAAARRLLSLMDAAPQARVAIIELASASGLALLRHEERDLWHTTTAGTGELIGAATRRGAAAIVLGIGGSATNDLGLGALAALGLRFTAGSGEVIAPPTPARWEEIARIAGALPNDLPPLFLACDVHNPLLGPRGAAAVYGPQKGLAAADRPRLEHAAARLALLLCHHFGQPDSLMETPGTGAAGGIAFGLIAAAGARLLPGSEVVAAWLELERRLQQADLVLTGEGRFDESSLEGKGPGALVARALALHKPVHVFAGCVDVTHRPAGVSLHAITPVGTPLAAALAKSSEHLAAAIAQKFAGMTTP